METLNSSIVGWIEKNFAKALIPFHVNKKAFKFARVLHISKVWRDNDYWTVEAMIEFNLGGNKSATIIYQVDDKGNIMGYSVPKINDI